MPSVDHALSSREPWPNRSNVFGVSTVTLDVEAVRARFSALRQPLAFFDGPGGTQVPDEVIEAVSPYYRESNANVSGPYDDEPPDRGARGAGAANRGRVPRLRRRGGDLRREHDDARVRAHAHCGTRAGGQATRSSSRSSTTTPTSRRGSSSRTTRARRALRRHRATTRRSTSTISSACSPSAHASSRSRSRPTRSARSPTFAASRARHTASARSRGRTPSTTARTARSTSTTGASTCSICSPYKFFGPHLGVAFGRAELLETLAARTRCDPRPNEPLGHRFETGTLAHELLAGFVAAVEYIDSIGWDAIRAHERALGERFLAGLPDDVTLYGLPTMEGRVATFAFNVDGSADARGRGAPWRRRLRGLAGELLRGRGDEPARPRRAGAVRAGIVHYNTADEVDGLLAAIAAL